MFGGRKSRIQRMLRDLDGIANEAPDSFGRFHERRRRLKEAVQDLDRKLLGPRELQVQSKESDVHELRQLGSRLRKATDLRHGVARDFGETAARTGRQAQEQEQADWLQPCATWLKDWERLALRGSPQRPDASIDATRNDVESVEEDVGELWKARDPVIKCAELLVRASSLVNRLPPLDQVELHDKINTLSNELLPAPPALPSGLDKLTETLTEFEDRARQLPRTKPRELGEARELVYRAQRWSQKLDERTGAVGELLRELDEVSADPSRWNSASELKERSHALLTRLERTAHERRENQLAKLVANLDELRQANAADARLMDLVSEARRPMNPEPQDYETWEKAYRTAEAHFTRVVASKTQELFGWVEQRAAQLEKRISRMDSRPLPQAVRRQSADLNTRVGKLSSVVRVDALQAVRDVSELESALREAEAQAEESWKEFEGSLALLAAQAKELQEAGQTVGLSSGALATRVKTLVESPPGTQLDDLIREADTLKQELGTTEGTIIGDCQKLVRKEHQDYEQTVAVLNEACLLLEDSSAGVEQAPVSVRRVDEPATVKEAVRLVVRARKLRSQIDAEAVTTASRLLKHTQAEVAHLRELQSAAGSARDREAITELEQKLQRFDQEQETEPRARLRALIDTARACDLLMEHLARDQRDAQAREAGLRERLELVRDQLLIRYAENEFARVEALLDGIQWSLDGGLGVAEQLDEAERLLSRAEEHGRRRAGAELAAAAKQLRGNPTDRVRAVLDRLSSAGHRKLPSYLLRRDVLKLAERRQRG